MGLSDHAACLLAHQIKPWKMSLFSPSQFVVRKITAQERFIEHMLQKFDIIQIRFYVLDFYTVHSFFICETVPIKMYVIKTYFEKLLHNCHYILIFD